MMPFHYFLKMVMYKPLLMFMTAWQLHIFPLNRSVIYTFLPFPMCIVWQVIYKHHVYITSLFWWNKTPWKCTWELAARFWHHHWKSLQFLLQVSRAANTFSISFLFSCPLLPIYHMNSIRLCATPPPSKQTHELIWRNHLLKRVFV